jgi:hypothetical protein
MPTEPKNAAERQLAKVAGSVSAAEAKRDQVIVSTADQVTRRRAAALVGLAASRVQQIINEAKEAV